MVLMMKPSKKNNQYVVTPFQFGFVVTFQGSRIALVADEDQAHAKIQAHKKGC